MNKETLVRLYFGCSLQILACCYVINWDDNVIDNPSESIKKNPYKKRSEPSQMKIDLRYIVFNQSSS